MKLSIIRLVNKVINVFSKKNTALHEGKIERANKLISIIENLYGYGKSYILKNPVDRAGRPIPWFTYPAIEYLSQIDFSNMDVFEYGCGNGSLYWADRVKSVTSIEHNSDWYGAIKKKLRKNQKVYLFKDRKEYAKSIEGINQKYDVIVIDGEYRLLCAKYAIKQLKSGGIIILDNSDWFVRTSETLRDSGLLQVDFSGFGPINHYTWTTSIFFTEGANKKFMSSYNNPAPIGGRKIDIDDE